MSGVERVISEIGKLPPVPQVVQRLAGLLQDQQMSAARLVELAQLDQALTADVLRVCNSGCFGAQRQVSSLQQALTLMGDDRLLDIVMSQGIARLFAGSSQGYNLARCELWRHSVGAALGSQLISRRLGGRADPCLYAAALLHDVGKVILGGFVAESLEEIRALVRERGCSFAEAERLVVGIDHAELGARMCELWGFPPQLVAGVRYHHRPESEEADYLSALVCVSDLICMLMGIGAGADGLAYHGGDSLVARLGLSEHDIHLVMAELAEEIQRAEAMLKI